MKYIRLLFICIAALSISNLDSRNSKRKKYRQAKTQTPSIAYKKIERLTFAESEDALAYYKKHEMNRQVINVLERMMALATDHETLKPILRELADLKFQEGLYSESAVLYSQYALLYPGEDTQYIQLQIIHSFNNERKSPENDQTTTQKTLEKALEFTETFPESTYQVKINDIILNCRLSLLLHELNAAEFYHHKFSYTSQLPALNSAHERLLFIKNEFIPALKDTKLDAIFNEFPQTATPDDAPLLSKIIQKTQTYITEQTINDKQKQSSWFFL